MMLPTKYTYTFIYIKSKTVRNVMVFEVKIIVTFGVFVVVVCLLRKNLVQLRDHSSQLTVTLNLKLLSSRYSPTSASQVARTTDVCH